MNKYLLILGCGYVGCKIAKVCMQHGIHVSGTSRSVAHGECLQKQGITPVIAPTPLHIADEILQQTTHLVDSIPLTREAGVMVASQNQWLPELAPQLKRLQWAAYLSSTGVYGDANGAWVDESYNCQPSSPRGIERLKAEQALLGSGLPAEVFRLAGIYGAERNIIPRLMAADYKAVQWSPPHYSSRVHVDDIVAALLAAMQSPCVGRIVNITDDLPLPHADYVQQLADMIGAPQPIILSPEEGKNQLSAAALSFFTDHKRISNQRLHDELLPKLKYPSFQEGMRAILNLEDIP
ncbi:MAG: SDR family oxidoreductase [Mariprofundaceae bacterium]|nr:SDR family oxidoreductase [Mariprofundaceae bacterium]